MSRTPLAELLLRALAGSPLAIEAYDGSTAGPSDAKVRLVLRSPKALSYLITAPSSLGFARAYVSGELEIHGDLARFNQAAACPLSLKIGLHQGPCIAVRAYDERLDYFGSTAWNTDFAADSTSSATLVCSRSRGAGGSASARRSSGGRVTGMSAGGVGRRGSLIPALAG